MSLAYALFGAPRYPTGKASDGSADTAPVQFNTDQPAHDYHDRFGIRSSNTTTWLEKRGPDYSDDSTHKRPRGDMTPLPLETALSPLVPVQPTSPPPAHILRARTYPNTVAESPTRSDKILRWISYAIRFGGQSIGIDVVDGWAHLHELAKAASSERKDFAGLTPGALHNIIESDVSGRWWLSGGRVCKVPRADRYPVSFSTPKEEPMSVSWVSFG